ncbi:hypothetical protein HZA75_02305 [Candidatus Roizmanbacteria bacterium]|nr:hypothetical protein [Candidatus Roizmanbacteria bacterium]
MENKNKIFIYLLVIFFAAFVGSGIFLLTSNKKTTSNEQAVSTSTIQQKNVIFPTPIPTKGFINLENNSAVNQVNNPVDLNLLVDSNGENVTAFDTVISYDPVSFDFVKVDSFNPNFKVYSYKRNNRLTLTVVKTGQNNIETIFNGKTVAKLVFQPKTKGNFTFAVLSSYGQETTKFVNEKTEIIYPGTNELKVTVN